MSKSDLERRNTHEKKEIHGYCGDSGSAEGS